MSFLDRFREESRLLRFYLYRYKKFVSVGVLALVVVDGLEILPPILLKETIDAAMFLKPKEAILVSALAYALVTILQSVGRYLWRMYLIRASMWAGRDMRDKFVSQLFQLSTGFYDKNRIGDLMSLATNDVEAIRMALGAGLLTIADAFFYLATVPFIMLWLSPELTLLAFAPMPLVPFWVMRNERRIHERFKEVQGSFAGLSAMAQEGLNGIRVVKAYAREAEQVSRFSKEGEEFMRLGLRLSRVQSAFGPSLDFIMSLGLVLLLWYGGGATLDGAVTLGTFVAFQRYVQKLIWPMTAVGMGISFYQRAVASSQRYTEVVEQPSPVKSPLLPELPSHFSPGAWKAEGKIEWKNLSFRFSPVGDWVLKDVNLAVAPGERVAFIGSVGAGKSAILSLLPRLYPVEDGMIFVDDVDVNRWPLEDLRRQIGIVPQDVFLFSDTVADNVALGIRDWLKDDRGLSTVENSARIAKVYEEVLRLPKGWGTELGERGVNLSGGQRQRLTLARALAREPSILILDDALASVDTQTEEAILKGLAQRQGRKTELIAAHRVSTVRSADRIVVLAGGTVVQVGTHASLIRQKSGLYRSFYDQQRLKDDLEAFADAVSPLPEGQG